jgi:glycosyltransferase involved in cell wall biosynthesis
MVERDRANRMMTPQPDPRPNRRPVTPPELSIIVPTRDRPALLARCLDALLAQATQREYEVVIVNDGGRLEATTQLDDPRVVVLATGGTGPARARNRGVEEARGDVLLFTDDDTIPSGGWLEAAASSLEGEPDAVGVEGPVDGGGFDPLFEHSIENELPGVLHVQHRLSARCLLARRRLRRRVPRTAL